MSRSQDQTDTLTLLRGGHLPEPADGPSSSLLQVFPNACQTRPYIICIDFPEFTSLCPVTGQPDFGRIHLAYIPDAFCVESKSYKLYMFAFRNHHSFMETITNTILDDLIRVMHPLWCRVDGLFVPRGGTRISVFAEEMQKETSPRMDLVRELVSGYRTDRHTDLLP
ncbi:MAG: preQ(1) synthase [Desulfovibrio sp.]|nr:preQ(1) synthase [Desulfovibrio sp.]